MDTSMAVKFSVLNHLWSTNCESSQLATEGLDSNVLLVVNRARGRQIRITEVNILLFNFRYLTMFLPLVKPT